MIQSQKLLLLITITLIGFLSVKGQQQWTADPVHSAVRFSVSHFVISDVTGSFKVFSGTINQKGADFSGAAVSFMADVNSINTDNEMRDNHLKSATFFSAEKFPTMTFKSASFKKKKGNLYELDGDLTIRDVTRSVRFMVVYGGTVKDAYGNTRVGFKANGQIKRFDYGIQWNERTEAGELVVGNEINIELNLEFIKK
jgi:polyisoprenoid-binding protein YceI